MDDKYSTDSAGFDPNESYPGDTGSVQHPGEHVRQKSLANLSAAQLTYQHLAESDEGDSPDGEQKELVTAGEEVYHDVDIDKEKEITEAAKLDQLIRDTVESVLDGPGTYAVRVNDTVIQGKGQLDPETKDTLRDKMSTSSVILVNKECHRSRCCVM